MNNIRFLGSFPSETACPDTGLPEVAFVGRSNVGKSSLINYLTARKSLAKTSGTPGKTQLLNFFEVDERWVLVDLPGYGYARASKKDRARFERMIRDYLKNRANLLVALQLIDVRIPPQDLDIQNINWMGEHQIPFCLVFTKVEKTGKDQIEHQIQLFFDRLRDHWETMPKYFETSATGKTGREALLKYINAVLSY